MRWPVSPLACATTYASASRWMSLRGEHGAGASVYPRMGLFGEIVGDMLGELSAMRKLREESPLDYDLLVHMRMRRVPNILPDCEAAADAWNANCGPMSLAAVLGLPTVEAARPLVQPFRGFMSPTHMVQALERGFGLMERWANLGHQPADPWPSLGLVRIQWEGSWLDPGVDKRAAYRYTHWVGVRRGLPEDDDRGGAYDDDTIFIYDCTPNAWLPLDVWADWNQVIWPKRATGWRPVTRIDVTRRTGR